MSTFRVTFAAKDIILVMLSVVVDVLSTVSGWCLVSCM